MALAGVELETLVSETDALTRTLIRDCAGQSYERKSYKRTFLQLT